MLVGGAVGTVIVEVGGARVVVVDGCSVVDGSSVVVGGLVVVVGAAVLVEFPL